MVVRGGFVVVGVPALLTHHQWMVGRPLVEERPSHDGGSRNDTAPRLASRYSFPF